MFLIIKTSHTLSLRLLFCCVVNLALFRNKMSSKNLVSAKIVIFRKAVYGTILSIISLLLLLLLFADLIKLEYMNVIDTKFPPNCKIIPAPFVVLGLKWFQQIVGFIASVHVKIHIKLSFLYRQILVKKVC